MKRVHIARNRNPKQKGAAFERAVCVALSKWVSGDERQDLFWRSAMSGGRSTLGRKKHTAGEFTAQAGDVTATDPLGHLLCSLFMIECKFYANLRTDCLAWRRIGVFGAFFAKARTEARRFQKLPMLIAKQNGFPELVAVCPQGYRVLLSASRKGHLYSMIARDDRGRRFYIVPLAELVERLKFDRIRRKFKDLQAVATYLGRPLS